MKHNIPIDLNDLDYMNLQILAKENYISIFELFERFASDLVYGAKSNGGNQHERALEYLNSCQYDFRRAKEEKKEMI